MEYIRHLKSDFYLYHKHLGLIVVVRGLKSQQAAASINFVGRFLPILFYFLFLPLLSALNDRTGPNAGPLAQITYSILQWIEN